MELVTKIAAKENGLKRFFTGKPCRHGHTTERRVSDGRCYGCVLLKDRAWRAKNTDRARASVHKWASNNPEKLRARQALRDASKLQRTPSWVDRDGLSVIYRAAEVASVTFGIPLHVDHAIPLRGRLVSGLHVHNNLRIISAHENVVKHNSYLM